MNAQQSVGTATFNSHKDISSFAIYNRNAQDTITFDTSKIVVMYCTILQILSLRSLASFGSTTEANAAQAQPPSKKNTGAIFKSARAEESDNKYHQNFSKISGNVAHGQPGHRGTYELI